MMMWIICNIDWMKGCINPFI